jgi:hypothetical protein
MDVQLQIPDDVARVIQNQQPMLGFRTRMQVHTFLKAHNVYLNYSIRELENDLASLKHFEETLTE